MKNKGIILVISLVLFSSCIVKSLQPFYIKESLSFNDKLVGQWMDNKKGQWIIESLKAKFEEDKKEGMTPSEEDLLAYERYKDGYYVNYLKKEKEAGFIAMPFKIEDQYFLDFIPIEIEDEEINSLAAQHLLKTHSVAKLDITSDKMAKISWLSEEKITDILNEDKMRIKHESIGPEETLLLTASSEELYNFLKKYMKSDIKDKWGKEGKDMTSGDRLTLTRTNAKP